MMMMAFAVVVVYLNETKFVFKIDFNEFMTKKRTLTVLFNDIFIKICF